MKNRYTVTNRFPIRYADFIEGKKFTPLFEEKTNYNSLDRKIQKPYGKSNYSTSLYVNKLAKLYFGIKTTGVLRNIVKEALRTPGDKASALINCLEHKLDFQVYRAGYAKSLGEARELIKHGAVCISNFDDISSDEPTTTVVTLANYYTKPGEIVSINTAHVHPTVLIRCYMNYFGRLGLHSKWSLYKKIYMDACLYENLFLRIFPVTRIVGGKEIVVGIEDTTSSSNSKESFNVKRRKEADKLKVLKKSTNLFAHHRLDIVDLIEIFAKGHTVGSKFYSNVSKKIAHELSGKNWYLTKAILSGIDLKDDKSAIESVDDRVDAKSSFEISLKKNWDAYEKRLIEFAKMSDDANELFFIKDGEFTQNREYYIYQVGLILLGLERQIVSGYHDMIEYTKTALLFHKWDNIRNQKIGKIVDELTELKTPEGVESRVSFITKEIEKLEISSGLKQVGGRVVVMQPHKLEIVKKNIEELKVELEELGDPTSLANRVNRLRKEMNDLDKDRSLQTLFPYKTVPVHYENSASVRLPSILSVAKVTRKELSTGQRTFANLLIRSLKNLNY